VEAPIIAGRKRPQPSKITVVGVPDHPAGGEIFQASPDAEINIDMIVRMSPRWRPD